MFNESARTSAPGRRRNASGFPPAADTSAGIFPATPKMKNRYTQPNLTSLRPTQGGDNYFRSSGERIAFVSYADGSWIVLAGGWTAGHKIKGRRCTPTAFDLHCLNRLRCPKAPRAAKPLANPPATTALPLISLGNGVMQRSRVKTPGTQRIISPRFF